MDSSRTLRTYVRTYGVVWLAKFAIYQLIVFRPVTATADGGEGVTAPENRARVEQPQR